MEAMGSTLENPQSVISCENCKHTNASDKKYCSECSFPIQGTGQEKQSFRLILSSRKRLLSDAEEKIKSAKYMIYVAAAIFFLSGFFVYFAQDDFATLIVNLVISLIYLILAAWSDKNPFGAILTAFIVYATVQLVNVFVEPSSFFSGIFIKVLLIAAFVKGIRSALDAQKLIRELQRFKAAPSAND